MPVFSGDDEDDDGELPPPWQAADPRDPHEPHAIEWLPAYRDIDVVGAEVDDGDAVVYDPDYKTNDRWVKTDRWYDLTDCR